MNIIQKYNEEKKKLIENMKSAYKATNYKNMIYDMQGIIKSKYEKEFSYHEIRNTLTGIYRMNKSREVIVDVFINLINEMVEKMEMQNAELKKINLGLQ